MVDAVLLGVIAELLAVVAVLLEVVVGAAEDVLLALVLGDVASDADEPPPHPATASTRAGTAMTVKT